MVKPSHDWTTTSGTTLNHHNITNTIMCTDELTRKSQQAPWSVLIIIREEIDQTCVDDRHCEDFYSQIDSHMRTQDPPFRSLEVECGV